MFISFSVLKINIVVMSRTPQDPNDNVQVVTEAP